MRNTFQQHEQAIKIWEKRIDMLFAYYQDHKNQVDKRARAYFLYRKMRIALHQTKDSLENMKQVSRRYKFLYAKAFDQITNEKDHDQRNDRRM